MRDEKEKNIQSTIIHPSSVIFHPCFKEWVPMMWLVIWLKN